MVFRFIYNLLPPNLDFLGGFLLFNYFPIAPQLWYCFAYLYVLFIVVALMNNPLAERIIVYSVPLLFIVNLFLGSYSGFLNLENWQSYYSRNFLLLGLLFYICGALVRKYENRIPWRNIAGLSLVWLFVIGTYIEALLLKYSGLRGDLYISTIPLALLTFIMCLKVRIKNQFNLLIYFGKYYSIQIFFYHMLVIYLMNIYLRETRFGSAFINPVFVLFATILLIKVGRMSLSVLKRIYLRSCPLQIRTIQS